jgi:hypothetical protein
MPLPSSGWSTWRYSQHDHSKRWNSTTSPYGVTICTLPVWFTSIAFIHVAYVSLRYYTILCRQRNKSKRTLTMSLLEERSRERME